MSIESDEPLSDKARDILARVEAWVTTFPPDTLSVSQLPIPDDDDYGLELILLVEPSRTGACPVEIGVIKPAAGSTVYICLDKWAAIARRAGLRLSDEQHKGELVGLYVEPIQLSVEQVSEICKAVAAGSVTLEIGVIAGKLVSTAGYVNLRGGRFNMRGIGGGRTFLKLTDRLGLTETRRIKYEPWA